MASLIEEIVALEKRASEIVEAAQAQAKSIAEAAEADAERIRADIDAETNRRIEQYRAQAETQTADALADVKKEFNASCASIGAIDERIVQAQVDRVLARMNEV